MYCTMKIIMILWAKLTGSKLVWLKDLDGEVALSIAYQDTFGDVYAKRWWPFNIRTVQLLDNGKIENGYYVERWIEF